MTDSALSKQMAETKLLAEGLKKRVDAVGKVGLTEARAEELTALVGEIEKLNAEQEELKARLKTKTAELAAKQKSLKALASETKKLVKIGVAKDDWLTFGITDKQ